jgi:MoaA/NifB/PqqE/SkfB family radical SAM enzyme
MNWYRQVHKLQIDVTSHCNARCGACIRNINGGQTRPGLELAHFDLDVWKRMAREDTKGWYVRQLTLNGNWGDPMMHPNLVEMLEVWIDQHPESFVSIATNGSMRGIKFWADLAKVLRRSSHHKIDFAVDGMEDTHHLYRRKTVFSKLIENIKSFTDAKGNATVQMTMFEHNKHQVEEVKELSRSIGIREFNARQSHTKEMDIIDGDENYHISGHYLSNDKEYKMQERFEENDHPVSDNKDNIWLKVNDRFNELNQNYIPSKCPWKDEGEIQIDPWGVVWPCCHISLYGGSGASKDMSIAHDFSQEAEDNNLINEGKRENSLHDNSLGDILNNDWFNERVNNAIDDAEWKICGNKCGVCK